MASELFDSIWKKVDDDYKRQHPHSNSKHCIYRVPDKLRKLKEDAYSPRRVSIGPLHMDDSHLKSMEEHKEHYMHRLFRRTIKSDHTAKGDLIQTITNCVDAMMEAADGDRDCYEQRFDLDKKKFAEIMLIDGCFILELLYTFQEEVDKTGDPIFCNYFVLHDIMQDLVLLENQIPFSVLEKLFHHTVKNIPNQNHLSLPKYILLFFRLMMNPKCDKIEKAVDSDDHILDVFSVDHILGFLHKYYQHESEEANNDVKMDDLEAGYNYNNCLCSSNCCSNSNCLCSSNCCRNTTPEGDDTITKYSATELDRSGVKLEASTRVGLGMEFILSCWLPNCISETPNCCIYKPSCRRFSLLFDCCGRARLKIKPISIFDSTERFLRNLIAYEQCRPGIKRIISSYACLMDTLIDTDKDVELLKKEKVLGNNLGASEDVCHLFNNICKEVVVPNLFPKQLKQVDDYCKRFWPDKLASLRTNYFSNPWALVSVIAALILFGLTIVQTVYTILYSV